MLENEYFASLRTACQATVLNEKQAGLIGSVIPARRRALKDAERERRHEVNCLLSKHFGVVGARYTIEATAEAKLWIDTQYGGTYLLKFRDGDGRSFIWWSNSQDMGKIQVADEIKIAVTVKDHNEYEGEKQTQVTRGKLV